MVIWNNDEPPRGYKPTPEPTDFEVWLFCLGVVLMLGLLAWSMAGGGQ